MSWIAAWGWLSAGVLAWICLRLRGRLGRVAEAEHELRGPLTAIGLAVEQVRRGAAGPELAGAIDAQLDRSRAGLVDLGRAVRGSGAECARSSIALERLVRHSAMGWEAVAALAGRPLRLDWRAGAVEVDADRGRVAQALGNLLANAVEHGAGAVELRGRRVGDCVRIEVADVAADAGSPRAESVARSPRSRVSLRATRGRGLRIASRAATEAGGRLEVVHDAVGTTAALELPVEGP